MKGKDALKEVMGMRRVTQTALAKMLGYPAQSGVSQRLQGKYDLRTDILAKFLEPLDCELIIRDKSILKEYGLSEAMKRTRKRDQTTWIPC